MPRLPLILPSLAAPFDPVAANSLIDGLPFTDADSLSRLVAAYPALSAGPRTSFWMDAHHLTPYLRHTQKPGYRSLRPAFAGAGQKTSNITQRRRFKNA